MSNSNIFRLGGIAAILCAVLYVFSTVVWMTAGTTSSPPLATGTYIGSQLIFLVTLFALYVLHKEESPVLALIATLVLAAAILLSLFIDPTDTSNPLVILLTIGYGVGAIILGLLAWRSSRLTRAIAITVLLVGVLSLIMVPFMLAGASADLLGMFNLALGIPYLLWLVLLGLRFLRRETLVVQAS